MIIDSINMDIPNAALRMRFMRMLNGLLTGDRRDYNVIRAECNISAKTSERFAVPMIIANYSMRSKILICSDIILLRSYIMNQCDTPEILCEVMDSAFPGHVFRYLPNLSLEQNSELAFDAAITVLVTTALSGHWHRIGC